MNQNQELLAGMLASASQGQTDDYNNFQDAFGTTIASGQSNHNTGGQFSTDELIAAFELIPTREELDEVQAYLWSKGHKIYLRDGGDTPTGPRSGRP